ncbi:hypothetical protein JHK82_031886 [Glycine max]|nr:hypothetical protein JHK82_031886 [Glycine max]
MKLVTLTLLMLWSWWSFEGAVGDPQTLLLKQDCSGFTAPNLSNFNQNLNASLADLRAEVSNQRKHFATSQSTTGTSPVYAMIQCRNYLSNTDCAACLAAADAKIRNCSTGANGARVIYDGCFLRYESNDFFAQIMPRSSILCGSQSADESTAFSEAGQQVLTDLQIATPKITGYYAATKTQVAGGAIYAIAQCAETLTQDNCLECLSNEQTTVQGCLPNTNGRAFDAGCFMRYSETPFFSDNQTIDIAPFLNQGNILEGTQLKGPTKFKYSDLKAATKNFSEKNKLGEGGFGAVYKVKSSCSSHFNCDSKELFLRDIKSCNILLDEELQPKISDFGLVKLLPEDKSHLSTRFAGTVGYTAPEYALHGQLSKKADTYSYGIVVLEIISGQKSTDVRVDDDGEEESLLRQAWKLYERGMHLELVDETLNDNYDAEEVKKIIEIALLCTQASAAMRPAMSEVVVLLSSNALEHMRPSMPIFIESKLKPHRDIFASTSSSTSNATASSSIVPAR